MAFPAVLHQERECTMRFPVLTLTNSSDFAVSKRTKALTATNSQKLSSALETCTGTPDKPALNQKSMICTHQIISIRSTGLHSSAVRYTASTGSSTSSASPGSLNASGHKSIINIKDSLKHRSTALLSLSSRLQCCQSAHHRTSVDE